ncbi:MAG: helix-turn-helix domain-containing protein [Lachnospiraceae bacterium]|nr:helix-turn-helix domain-containing protein [Lachnospiraceae bacterium]
MAIANNLKELRTQRNLNQEDLAVAIGSCCRTISRIERGERNPSLELALRIASYMELPLEDIFRAYDP